MEEIGGVSKRTPLNNDQPRDAQPLNRSKSSISVRHEDLRTELGQLDNSTLHRRPSSFQDITHQPTRLGTTPSRSRRESPPSWSKSAWAPATTTTRPDDTLNFDDAISTRDIPLQNRSQMSHRTHQPHNPPHPPHHTSP